MANEYKLEIYRKPLEAIKNGTKRIEIRTNNSYEDIDYKLLQSGDIISFQVINGPPFVNLDVIIPDALKVKVLNVKNYKANLYPLLVNQLTLIEPRVLHE